MRRARGIMLPIQAAIVSWSQDCAHCHMCPKDELKNRSLGMACNLTAVGSSKKNDLLDLKCINAVPPRKKRKTGTKKPPERRRSPRRSPRRSRSPERRRPDTPYEPNGDSYRAYYERAYGTPPPHPNPYYYPPPDPRYPPPAYGYPPPYGYYPPGYGYPPPAYGYPPGYSYPPGYEQTRPSRAESRGRGSPGRSLSQSQSQSVSESPSPKRRRRDWWDWSALSMAKAGSFLLQCFGNTIENVHGNAMKFPGWQFFVGCNLYTWSTRAQEESCSGVAWKTCNWATPVFVNRVYFSWTSWPFLNSPCCSWCRCHLTLTLRVDD